MNAIVTLDIFSFFCLLAAVGVLIFGRDNKLPGDVRWMVWVLLISLILNRFSNILNWSGISGKLEPIEDFIQMAAPFFYFTLLYSVVQEKLRADLRASEEKFRNIAEQMVDVIFTTDVHGVVTYVSPSAEKVFQRPVEELIEHKFSDLIAKEDVERAMAGFARTVRNESTANSFAMRATRPDGEVIFLELNGTALWRGDEVIGTLGIVRDVSERKKAEEDLRRSEERLALALQGADLGTWNWNIATGEVFFDEQWAKMLGYRVEEIEPSVSSWEKLLHPDDKPLVLKKLQAHMNGETPGYETEHRLLTKSGEWLWVLDRGRVMERDAAGKPIRAAGTHLDINEHKNAELEKGKLEEQLRQATKMEAVGRLAGGVAHDFNNLLTSIIGNLSLAQTRCTQDATTIELLTDIGQAADRAAQLTHQLLAFSRKQLIAPKVIDLNDAVRNTEKMLRRLIGEDIQLETFLTDRANAIKVDVNQLEQIIINLAVNARDAMVDGGRLTIETAPIVLDEQYCETHPEVKPGEYMMLAVSDTGRGIPKDVLTHIFEPFFTTKPMGQGSGLGLSMAFGIVKQHQGSISVYSEEGKGTTVRIYFPRCYEKTTVVAPKREASLLAKGRGTILVVEDEPMVRNVTVRVLERAGYTLLVAKDGEEALALAEENRNGIDLLLTDVVMPKMNGRELAQRLQSQYPQLKVLFTSGYTENIIAHHGVIDEGVAFLSKPFSAEGLACKVREVLNREEPC